MPKASIIYPSGIVDRNGNGGWHRKGKRAYRKAVQTIMACLQTYKEPRLYHLCFQAQQGKVTTNKQHINMLHALVQMADRAGIKCEWFAAREKADATKTDHLHVFIVIDAHGIKVAKVFNQFDDGQVAQLCNKHGIEFAIFRPKDMDGIHGKNRYMALPYQGPGNQETDRGRKRLADALLWLSYIGKARSKPTDEEADGQIFPASRPNRVCKPATPAAAAALVESPAAVPAAIATSLPVPFVPEGPVITYEQEPQHEISIVTSPSHTCQSQADTTTSSANSSPGSGDTSSTSASTSSPTLEPSRSGSLQGTASASSPGTSPAKDQCPDGSPTGPAALTPAARYVASRYEQAVDLGLDLEAFRLYLLSHGIRHTPAQVVHQLDNVHQFYGYASRHPAPAPVDLAAVDKLIDQMPMKQLSALVNRKVGVYNCLTDVSQSYTLGATA